MPRQRTILGVGILDEQRKQQEPDHNINIKWGTLSPKPPEIYRFSANPAE